MPTKVAILQEKDFAANMTQLMDIMKGLALASYVKYKKEKETRFETFIRSFDRFFYMADLTKAANPFITAQSDTMCIFLVTSEESFMSGLNSKIIRTGLEIAGNKPAEFVILGKKAISRLKAENRQATVFPPIKSKKSLYNIAVKVKDHIVEKVVKKEYGQVIVVYADPVSFSNQQATAVKLLPAHDIYPKSMAEGQSSEEKVTLESSVDALMMYLSEIWITNKLFMLFQDNKMAEFAAQAMQMDGSLQNLSELNRRLKLQYAKKRGELIDASLREIVTGLIVNKS